MTGRRNVLVSCVAIATALIICGLAVVLASAADQPASKAGLWSGLREFFTTPKKLTSAEEEEINNMVLPLPKSWQGDFDDIQNRHFIRILVPYSKTFYSVDRGEQQGVDFDYGKALEAWINKKYPPKTKNKPFLVVFLPVQRDQLLPFLTAGKGDIAAGGLTVTENRKREVDFVMPLASDVREILVTALKSAPVEKLEDLSGRKITVRPSSSYFEHLTAINKDFRKRGLAPIKIIAADEWLESEDLLEMVNAGLIQATVVDRYLALIWQPLFTDMQVHESFSVNEGGELAWAIRKDSPQLLEVLNGFMKEHKVGSTFGNVLVKRYVQDRSRVLNATSEEEMKKFNKLVELFKLHGETYSFDYLMLMALGYQESKLDQKARSHTGAVGIMQMLPSTAADPAINIKGIDKDAARNIEAGAKYLRFLIEKYLDDEQLDPVNRTLMAFAAYNAGPGNLRKFRRLAEKSGLNPNIWFQNVEHAAARIVGQETVKYVANIYKYYLAYKMATSMEKIQKK